MSLEASGLRCLIRHSAQASSRKRAACAESSCQYRNHVRLHFSPKRSVLVTTDAHASNCVFCHHNRAFEIPAAVFEALKRGKLTIFAGAGVSTEVSSAFPTTLYSELRAQAGLDEDADLTFPAVMSAFEEKFTRRALISEVVERFEYAESFPFIHRAATRFPRELATIGHIQTVITTNWDTSFEDFCHARPFVVDEDYAYYDLPGRKVFKIHGSVRSVSTLIATEEDYARREEEFRTSALGSTLKHLLATTVVVFVGYSLTDPDFQSVYRGLLAGLGRSRPPAFLVSPFPSPEASNFGLQVIDTDGTFFLHTLKQALVDADQLFPDEALDRLAVLRSRAMAARGQIEAMNWRKNPALFFSLAYLDGIVDCAERNLAKASSGLTSIKDHMAHTSRSYDRLLEVAVESERWWDAAYVNGYRLALLAMFGEDSYVNRVEMFEAFDGSPYPGIPDFEDEDDVEDDSVAPDLDESEILRRFKESTTTARDSIYEQFRKLTEHFGAPGVPRHTPFIDELMEVWEQRGGHVH